MKHIPPSKAKKYLKGVEVIGSVKLPEKDKPSEVRVALTPLAQHWLEAYTQRRFQSILKEIENF